jgi:hypothetical protein
MPTPVLQRLVDGKTHGIAIKALGAVKPLHGRPATGISWLPPIRH